MISVIEDPMAGFLNALRSTISKKKYPEALRSLRFNGEDDALEFLKKARKDPEWVEDMLMRFVSTQIERLNRGERAVVST
jgi:HEPN domain-containing protein